MSPLDWGFATALVTTGVAVLLPWMLMVHGRLAVVVSKLQDLEKRMSALTERLDNLWDLERQRQRDAARWQARLRTLEEPLGEIPEIPGDFPVS
ncbi:MAG: hypothetical protein H5U08_05555 [Thermogutta sp.]|uniref:hypothetical protein n=1 Tax=Thermogutta sp. TaxID=1962930 RepID=UPI0019B7E8D9|nr:hypothetical protein [Thermogutta sp.]MBC7351806.1 hypothetical protein [Thermogutta sp.]